jgi:hypothetical protein
MVKPVADIPGSQAENGNENMWEIQNVFSEDAFKCK